MSVANVLNINENFDAPMSVKIQMESDENSENTTEVKSFDIANLSHHDPVCIDVLISEKNILRFSPIV